MNDLLMYFLKVNIAIALFYLFYRLFFAGDTFWKTRRYYLLFSILISFVYPFLSIENWLQNQEPVQVFVANYAMLQDFTVTPTDEVKSIFSIENILLALYALVAAFLFIRLVFQFISILHLRFQGKREVIETIRIIAIDKEITPFSFFGSIYMNPALHSQDEIRQILAHELTHVRQAHSIDVLINELLCVSFWFNPAAWLLKRETRQNLEFLADNKVLKSGFDSKSYQYHLLQLAYQTPEIKLANKFNVSPLKKRIMKMNQQKTSKASILKYSLIVPLALALVLSSNAQNLVNKAKATLAQAQEPVTAKKKPVTATPPPPLYPKGKIKFSTPVITEDKSGVYSVVDKMPQYPGGEKGLLDYISHNLKYPVDAQEKGIQGRIVVRFVVTKFGKVENVETIRGLYPSMDKEGVRVISSLPDWIPGEQKGEKVAVYYTLPIQFALDGGVPSVEVSSSKGLTKTSIKVTTPTIKER